MEKLTAEEIYSLSATDYDGLFWITIEFRGKNFKCEAFSRYEDETSEEMRTNGYIYIENGWQWGKELWINVNDIH